MRELPKDEKDLAIYREMRKIDQGWTVLYFVLVIVAVLTGAFLYCLLWRAGLGLSSISASLDGLFGWCLRTIVKFHFPADAAEKDPNIGLVGKILSKL